MVDGAAIPRVAVEFTFRVWAMEDEHIKIHNVSETKNEHQHEWHTK